MRDEVKVLFNKFLTELTQISLDELIALAHEVHEKNATSKNSKAVLGGEDFFKLSNALATKTLSLSFESLSRLLELSISMYGPQMPVDIQVRKIKLFLKCQDATKTTELSLMFLKECAILSNSSDKSFRSQKVIDSVNNILQYLTPKDKEKFSYDILHPEPAFSIKEVTLTLLELDSWTLSQEYSVELSDMNTFLRNYQSYLSKKYPQHISLMQAYNNKKFNFYFTSAPLARACEIVLKNQLLNRSKKGNISVRTKVFDTVFDTIFEQQKLDLHIQKPETQTLIENKKPVSKL